MSSKNQKINALMIRSINIIHTKKFYHCNRAHNAKLAFLSISRNLGGTAFVTKVWYRHTT